MDIFTLDLGTVNPDEIAVSSDDNTAQMWLLDE